MRCIHAPLRDEAATVSAPHCIGRIKISNCESLLSSYWHWDCASI